MKIPLTSSIICLILIFASLSLPPQHIGMRQASIESNPSLDYANLTSELVLDKHDYQNGDTLNWTIKITNSGPTTAEICFSVDTYWCTIGVDNILTSDPSDKPRFVDHDGIVMWMIVNCTVQPMSNISIGAWAADCSIYASECFQYLLQNFTPGYYRVWTAIEDEFFTAWNYFTVGKTNDFIMASFSAKDTILENNASLVTVNASSSVNQMNDSGSLWYRWDWNKDFEYDTNWSSNPISTRVFDADEYISLNQNRFYFISLEVKDVFGNLASCPKIVKIAITPPEEGGDQLPDAVPSDSPQSLITLVLIFTAVAVTLLVVVLTAHASKKKRGERS